MPRRRRAPAQGIKYQHVKRLTDIFGSVLLLTITSPLMLSAMLAIKLTSPGPAVIGQIRLTQGGRRFLMFKLRTMRADAESSSGAVWASAKDPRITAVGSILRRFRIDELPQLINVLRDEMSLIGPRPERPEFAESLQQEFHSFARRMDMKAGLSGLAQVRAGYCSSNEEYRRKIAFDRLYVRHCSPFLDLNIAFRTVSVLIVGGGAR